MINNADETLVLTQQEEVVQLTDEQFDTMFPKSPGLRFALVSGQKHQSCTQYDVYEVITGPKLGALEDQFDDESYLNDIAAQGPGVLAFDGRIVDPTSFPRGSAEYRYWEDQGHPFDYDQFWQGEWRPATPAEIAALMLVAGAPH